MDDINTASSSSSNCPPIPPNNKTGKNTNNIDDKDGLREQDKSPINSSQVDLRSIGWYWGSISPKYSAKILEDEPEGTFLVRDSSSECYLFSISFKFEGKTHHSRIEHSKGYYTFGRSPKFRCKTIVGFIEQVIANSQNGNFSFFLHRDPSSEGPVRLRFQPYSRLKATQSLKHLCRFAILPYVKRHKINELCLPDSLTEYLIEPF